MDRLDLKAAHHSSRPTSNSVKGQRENEKRIATLGAIWPRFLTNPPLPLSLGIYASLCKEVSSRRLALTETQIRHALASYTRRQAYLQALAYGSYRYDQHGVITDTLTNEHKKSAKKALYERLKKNGKLKPTPKRKTPKQPVKAKNTEDPNKKTAPSPKSTAPRAIKKQNATRPHVTYKKRPKKRQIIPQGIESSIK